MSFIKEAPDDDIFLETPKVNFYDSEKPPPCNRKSKKGVCGGALRFKSFEQSGFMGILTEIYTYICNRCRKRIVKKSEKKD